MPKRAASMLLESYLFLTRGRRLLVVHDANTDVSVINSIRDSALDGDIFVEFHDASPGFASLFARLAGFDTVLFLEHQKSTFSLQVIQCIKSGSFPSTRFFRFYNAKKEVLSCGFRLARDQLQTINHKLISLGARAKHICIESDVGTRLVAKMSEGFGWVDSCGTFGRLPGVLPPSEVATYSPSINGTLVADGCLAANMGLEWDPRLRNNPIRLEIKDSYVVEWECDSFVVRYLLDQYFSRENTRKVGEIGFGTNIGMTGFFPFFCHMNERYPSFHLGLGAHHQGAICDWQCSFHLDCMTDRCRMYFDDDLIHENNRYFLPEKVESFPKNLIVGYADTV